MRRSVTVRFDDRYYEVLERWAKLGYQSSIAVLAEWLVAQAIDERQINVPPEVKQPPIEIFESLSTMCLHFWDKLLADPRISKRELGRVVDGHQKADEVMLLRIAIATGYPEKYLEMLNQAIDLN